MKRIICHWTGGAYKASAVDRKHYHFIFEGNGEEVRGNHPVEANKKNLRRGRYAAHTLRCNTGSIGLAVACMRGATENPLRFGPSPMTESQWNAMCQKAAHLCVEHGIVVTPRTVLSHAEVQGTLNIKQRGKWDFSVLPFAFVEGVAVCGDRLRADVREYMHQIESPPFETDILPAPGTRAEMERRWQSVDALTHLRGSGSRTIASGDMADRITAIGASASAVTLTIQQVSDVLDGLPNWVFPLLLIFGCACVFWYVRQMKAARIDDHIKGRNTGRPELNFEPIENVDDVP